LASLSASAKGFTARSVNGAFAEYLFTHADYVVPVDLEDENLDPAWELDADVAIALAVAPKAFEQAIASLRRGGRTRIIAETRRLDDINTCFEEVRHRPARLVFEFRALY
jgi:D-arabinose 1-dehydrogenase-like Zn-dependent alcohol dehydrogenase